VSLDTENMEITEIAEDTRTTRTSVMGTTTDTTTLPFERVRSTATATLSHSNPTREL
jgi:hypothetical protein